MNQKRLHQERYFPGIVKQMRMRSHLRLTTLLIEMTSRTSLSDHKKLKTNMPEKEKRTPVSVLTGFWAQAKQLCSIVSYQKIMVKELPS